MGIHRVERCIFTGLPVKYYEQGEMRDAIEYVLDLNTYGILFRLPYEAMFWGEKNKFFQSNKYIFEGLILNNNWFEDQEKLITIDNLKELLLQKTYPKTPQEKADLLFEYYLSLQNEDGQVVEIDYENSINWMWKKLYFK